MSRSYPMTGLKLTLQTTLPSRLVCTTRILQRSLPHQDTQLISNRDMQFDVNNHDEVDTLMINGIEKMLI